MSSTMVDPEDAPVGKKALFLLSQRLHLMEREIVVNNHTDTVCNCDRCFVEVHGGNKGT